MKRLISLLLAVTLVLSLTACKIGKEPIDGDPNETTAATTDSSAATEEPPPITGGYIPPELEDLSTLDPLFMSKNIDERGYWKDLTASDYVEMFKYNGMEIPAEIHNVGDRFVDSGIIRFLQQNYFQLDINQVTDRPAEDGDLVNIDYIGSIDDVAFAGGGTDGMGWDILIGVDPYIDNFTEQIIGHSAGDKFDINVTFPENYGKEELNGKAAVFASTVNYISEPVIDDEYVALNLESSYGWKSLDEFREHIRENIKKDRLYKYIWEYFLEQVKVETPDSFLELVKWESVDNLRFEASQYGMGFGELLVYYGIENGLEGLLERNREEDRKTAHIRLVFQAIAEDMELVITEEQVEAFLSERNTTVAAEVDVYGMPFLRQATQHDLIFAFIMENAVLM